MPLEVSCARRLSGKSVIVAQRAGQGGTRSERLLAAETMRLLQVLPLTEDVLKAAIGYDDLSFEDAQVTAAGCAGRYRHHSHQRRRFHQGT